MDKLTFTSKKGREIESVFDDLARLRIMVFRDYPYLYEGSVDYEKEYLATYIHSERAFLFGVYDGSQMVGATTCIPLKDEMPEVRQPFEEAGLEVDKIFYFAESILLPSYRGRGFGHRFFDEREAHARSFGCYTKACFLSVERPAHHPLRPAAYRSNEAFWQKRGYKKEPSIRATMEWPDIGEKRSSPKYLVCWMREL
ncbi:GNAT family N-acetyltransferase [Nafulsella turpanensis]|uniref:GNAT family N-acetyltransferase n=1 Tax=Nafulsella turpanensis TaxID=1265690 RepID=UPI0003458A3D|nr:GNAT family N-acetyltransferase [Nafulsella turpanensis]